MNATPTSQVQAIELLGEAVHVATDGAASQGRPSQIELTSDIAEAMKQRGHRSCEAPVGSGKSLAYGVPAARRAALNGERTVISTDSLALQSQLVDKDLPAIAEAVANLTGHELRFGVLKGWSNYICTATAVAAAQEIVARFKPGGRSQSLDDLLSSLDGVTGDPEVLIKADQSSYGPGAPSDQLAELLRWGLEAVTDPNGRFDGDRATFDGVAPNEVWSQVSISSQDCLGDDCPYAEQCIPRASRVGLNEADIVVTNHSMLAVQTSVDAPIVTGNKKLGVFRHLIVDEAHTLPGKVRAQGSSEMSGRAINRTVKVLQEFLDSGDKRNAELLSKGAKLSDGLALQLQGFVETRGGFSKSGDLRLEEDDDPLDHLASAVDVWASEVADKIARMKPGTMRGKIAQKKCLVKLTELRAATRTASEGQTGFARWMEQDFGDTVPAVKLSPVRVGPMLANRTWIARAIENEESGEWEPSSDDWLEFADADGEDLDGDQTPKYRLSVIAVSGTLPQGFPADSGLRCGVSEYESPFAEAYKGSLFYVPSAVAPEDVEALARPGGSKPQLDTRRHADWAAPHLSRLVEANGGAALVLSATSSAGKQYAEHLRDQAAGRWRVLSQWDGESTRQLVDEWRSDLSAVLVGTRGLMTGVDAPGETCSLVVVDRVPRSAPNPVDDARVESLVDAGIDKWIADRNVYVSDAGLLITQAAGRLIRSISDRGVVAVLDPRLVKPNQSVFRMAEQSRQMILKAMGEFTNRTVDEVRVLEFLRGQAARRSQSEAA